MSCVTYSRESRLLSFSLPCHRLLMTTLCSEISCCFPDESRRACSSGLRSWLISFTRIMKSNLFPLRAAKSDNQVEKEQEVLDENGSNLRTIRNLWVWFINRTHVEVSVGVSWHPDFISQVGSGTSVHGITRGRGELPSIACSHTEWPRMIQRGSHSLTIINLTWLSWIAIATHTDWVLVCCEVSPWRRLSFLFKVVEHQQSHSCPFAAHCQISQIYPNEAAQQWSGSSSAVGQSFVAAGANWTALVQRFS